MAHQGLRGWRLGLLLRGLRRRRLLLGRLAGSWGRLRGKRLVSPIHGVVPKTHRAVPSVPPLRVGRRLGRLRGLWRLRLLRRLRWLWEEAVAEAVVEVLWLLGPRRVLLLLLLRRRRQVLRRRGTARGMEPAIRKEAGSVIAVQLSAAASKIPAIDASAVCNMHTAPLRTDSIRPKGKGKQHTANPHAPHSQSPTPAPAVRQRSAQQGCPTPPAADRAVRRWRARVAPPPAARP